MGMMAVGEVLVAMAFAFIGFAGSVRLADALTPSARVWLAYPMGAAVWIVTSVVLLVLRIPYRPLLLMALLALLSLGLVLVDVSRGTDAARRSVVGLVASLVLAGSIAAVAVAINMTAMTNDSFWFLLQTETLLSAEGVWGPPEYLALRSFPIAVALLQAPAEIVGREYLASQPTVLSVTGTGTLIALAAYGVRRFDLERVRSWTVIIAGAIFLSTTYFVVFQAFYIRGNLEAGVYAAIAMATVWLGAVTGRQIWALPAGLAITSAILFRVESPLFLVPFVGIVVATVAVPRQVRAALLGAYSATALGWYGSVMLLQGEGRIMDGLSISVVMLTVPVLVGVFALAGSSSRYGIWLRERAGLLTIGALVIVSVAVTVWRPSWMGEAFLNIARNMFEPAQGLWGVTWILLVPLFLFAVRYPRLPHSRLFTVPIGSYFLLLYVSAAFFKVPHKLGWASSANRMLSVILLAAWMFVLLHYSVPHRDASAAPEV